MKTEPRDLLFVGTYGHVRAVNKQTGEAAWTTSLPGTGHSIVSLLYEPGILFAGSKGMLFALEPANGSILWTNQLKGLGFEHMVLASTEQTSAPPVVQVQAIEDAKKRVP